MDELQSITPTALAGSAHGNDVVCDVSQVKVISVFLVPPFVLGHDTCEPDEGTLATLQCRGSQI